MKLITKEPWQMTLRAYRRARLRAFPAAEYIEWTHRMLVRKALAEGKPVLANVLADYPDLGEASGGQNENGG